MIELYKENDVQLLFWIFPYWALDDYMKVYNTMGDYAAESEGVNAFALFSYLELHIDKLGCG